MTTEGFAPFVVNDDMLRVAYPRYGRISGHEFGVISCEIAEVPVQYLPRDPARAVRFLHAVHALGAVIGMEEGSSE
jgi:hypothetical protein